MVAPLNDQGASRVGCLVGVVVLILAGYAAVEFIGAEIDYRALSSQVQRSALAARETPDAGVAVQIREKAAELALPPSAGAPSIARPGPNRVTISLAYPDSVSFFGRWHWVIDRRIDVDQTY